MSLASQPCAAIPAEPPRVARAALPPSPRVMQMRDPLGDMQGQSAFEALDPPHGKPAEAPWRLALVTGRPFAEDLSDRAAAPAVRSRIDWTQALRLALPAPGFPYSVRAKVRKRLITGQAEQGLLDAMRDRLQERGLLKAGGRARLDSTHGLAAVRACTRLECVGETLRAALPDLAVVAPDWLRQQITAEWVERQGKRFEESRFPQGEAPRYAQAEQMGPDGVQLLNAISQDTAPHGIRAMPRVEILRQTWGYQYDTDEQGRLRWRTAQHLPPAGMRLDAPYDPEAHFGNKRRVTWTGYKVPRTETCDEDTLHGIPHVETTEAAVSDGTMPEPIPQALADKRLVPETPIVEAGYGDAPWLVESPRACHMALLGPVRPNISWPAQNAPAYDISQFTIAWEAHQVPCPRGKTSSAWSTRQDRWQNPVSRVKVATKDWRDCEGRPCGTKAKTAPRHMTLRPQSAHQALQAVRQPQGTTAWQAHYDKRAGIEGTLSQGVRAFGLRQCRSRGLPTPRLQHLATAAAITIARLAAWLDGHPHAKTRIARFAALAA